MPWWGWMFLFLILFPLDLIPDMVFGPGQTDDVGYGVGFAIGCIKCWLGRW